MHGSRGSCDPTRCDNAASGGRAPASLRPARLHALPRDRSQPRALRRVVIKGGTGDGAVLCTKDATYALKYVETTNTLLLLPPGEVRAGPAPTAGTSSGCHRVCPLGEA
jgi:hypothetical protein